MTTTQKPILFLDVDGVLNAFAPTRAHSVHRLGGTWVKGEFRPYTIKFDNDARAMVEALTEHFDVVWATMWNEKANTEIVPALGVGPFPVMLADHNKGWDTALSLGTEQWNIHRLWYAKTPLLPEYAAGRPFAWLDDDHSRSDRVWLAEQVEQPFLLVQTEPYAGVSWDDVNDLIAWAQSLAAGTLRNPQAFQGKPEPELPTWADREPVLVTKGVTPLDDDNLDDIDWDDDESVHGFLAALENEEA